MDVAVFVSVCILLKVNVIDWNEQCFDEKIVFKIMPAHSGCGDVVMIVPVEKP